MLMYVYLGILALLILLIGVDMFKKEKDVMFQIDAALVLIPLLLRLFLIK